MAAKKKCIEIVEAKRAGFCFGVKRAVDIAFDIAGKNKGVYTLGPIIHNPQVVEKLEESGVKVVDGVEGLKRVDVGAVIVRTHGVPQPVMEELRDAGYNIIDATCPFVKKAQHYAKLLKEEGYKVIILGDREHPEVKGLMSYAGDDVIVVKDETEYSPMSGRVGIVVQTTQQIETLKRLLSFAVERAGEIKVYNTICNSTALRLRETAEMAGRVDVMIIGGGKNSANTTQLANLCKSMSVPTHHIETADELKDEWFNGAKTVGITAGASTPDWIIKEIKCRILDIGGRRCDGNGD